MKQRMLIGVYPQKEIQFAIQQQPFQCAGVVQIDLHVYIGKLLLKLRDDPRDYGDPPGGRHSKAYAAPHAAADIRQFVGHAVLQRLNAGQITDHCLPLRGQLQAGAALEKGDLVLLLQSLNMVAETLRRDKRLLCRPGKIEFLGGQQKHLKASRHVFPPFYYDHTTFSL